MAEYKLIINGRLSGLNEYTGECRRNPYAGAKMKAKNENLVYMAILDTMRGVRIKNPVYIEYTWYEKNKRRDLDNIAFAKKFINDALVKNGILQDDNWKCVTGYKDSFFVDKTRPRIEVLIKEI